VFKDYYKILNVPSSADMQTIRAAYRQMSLKFHPDRNKAEDATRLMQDINEAYAILSDEVKRRRYDVEYGKFQNQFNIPPQKEDTDEHSSNNWEYDYHVQDEELKENMAEARQYAQDLVKEFLNSLKDDSKRAAHGAWEEVWPFFIILFFSFILGCLIKGCE